MVSNNFRYLKFVFWTYALFILIMAVVPLSQSAGGSDKLLHFLVFFIFGTLLKTSFNSSIPGTIIISLVYGGIIEIIQFFLPYRSCELLDLFADGFGGAVGVLSLVILYRTPLKKSTGSFNLRNKNLH